MAAEQQVSVLNVTTRYVSEVDKKSIDKTKKQTGGLLKLFKQLAPALGAAVIVRGLAQIGNAAVQAAADFEVVVESFRTLTGSASTARDLINDIIQFSIVTPFDPDQLNRSAKTLLSFGRATEDVIEDLTILGEISAATGANIDQLSLVFGQVAGAGRLLGQDALQFVNAGVPIYKLLAENMGISIARVRELGEQGKISFDIVRDTLAEATLEGGKFSGALERQSQTLTGLRSTLRGLGQEILRNLGQRILNPVKALTKQFISLADALNRVLAVSGSDQLAAEAAEIEVLVRSATAYGTTLEERLKLLNELDQKYPEFLQGLETDKVTNAELKKIMDGVNESYRQRVLITSENEKVDKALRKEKKATQAVLEAERRVYDQASKALAHYGIKLDDNVSAAGVVHDAEIKLNEAVENGTITMGKRSVVLDAIQRQTDILAKSYDKLAEAEAATNAARAEKDSALSQNLTPEQLKLIADEEARQKAAEAKKAEEKRLAKEALALAKANLAAAQKAEINAEIAKNDALAAVAESGKEKIEEVTLASQQKVIAAKQRTLQAEIKLARLEGRTDDIDKARLKLSELRLEVKTLLAKVFDPEVLGLDIAVDEYFKEQTELFDTLVKADLSPPEITEDFQKYIDELRQMAVDSDNAIFEARVAFNNKMASLAKDDFDGREKLALEFDTLMLGLEENRALAFKDLAFAEGDTKAMRDFKILLSEIRAEMALIGAQDLSPEEKLIQKIFGDDADADAVLQGVNMLYGQLLQMGDAYAARREQQIADEVDSQRRKIDDILSLSSGASQSQLEIQEERYAAALRQQEEFNRREVALAKATATANFIAAIAKVAAESGVASLGTLPLVLSALAGAIAFVPQLFLAKGEEYVQGAGSHTSDSIPAMLSRGERVVSAKDNMALAGIKNSDLARKAALGHKLEMGQLSSRTKEFTSNAVSLAELKGIRKEMMKMNEAISGLKLEAHATVNDKGLQMYIDKKNSKAIRNAKKLR